MIIKDLKQFKELVQKYQENFGSAMYDIDGTLYGTFDLYRILRNYMITHNINNVTLTKGIDWDNDIIPKNKYVLECTAFKQSGKYYTSMRHELLESNTEKWTDDFPTLNEKKEEILKDLDSACGLREGSVEQNNFIVLVEILDIKDVNNQSCFKALIKL